MVASIDLATEHPLLSVAVAKHQFLRLTLVISIDRAVPTMVTSIDLATEHPLLSVAVAKHQFLRLSLFLFGDRIHVVGGASTPCFT